MAADLPCPVLIKHGSPGALMTSRPRLGLLLEWRQRPDPRGHEDWQGLVVDAFPPVSISGSWEVRITWMDAAYLQPVTPPDGNAVPGSASRARPGTA